MREIKIGAIDGVIHISTEEFERVVAEIRADAIDELYSHKYAEHYDSDDTMVYIWKSWFDKLKEKKE